MAWIFSFLLLLLLLFLGGVGIFLFVCFSLFLLVCCFWCYSVVAVIIRVFVGNLYFPSFTSVSESICIFSTETLNIVC